jgi:hypothetical protein
MDTKSFDHEEFKQSYEHYRHLEQERSRHLAFFFTLVGGLLGLITFLVKDGKPITGLSWVLFVGGLTVVFLQILDIVVFAAIRRIGDARTQHAAAINLLRSKYGGTPQIVKLWKDFENRSHISVQRAAELPLSLNFLLPRLRSSPRCRRCRLASFVRRRVHA